MHVGTIKEIGVFRRDDKIMRMSEHSADQFNKWLSDQYAGFNFKGGVDILCQFIKLTLS